MKIRFYLTFTAIGDGTMSLDNCQNKNCTNYCYLSIQCTLNVQQFYREWQFERLSE